MFVTRAAVVVRPPRSVMSRRFAAAAASDLTAPGTPQVLTDWWPVQRIYVLLVRKGAMEHLFNGRKLAETMEGKAVRDEKNGTAVAAGAGES